MPFFKKGFVVREGQRRPRRVNGRNLKVCAVWNRVCVEVYLLECVSVCVCDEFCVCGVAMRDQHSQVGTKSSVVGTHENGDS